ncbi:type IX secretion system sortase PorU [Lutimonas zeaxanthinifaciens]|uniref:type IX secretion system sortase PorU n=1 Tax=Lutimonas zeaxanthinifaciens TaxID=3060215 RepID=UPI00265D00EB|nr:type IX secretion system sortase PorU [Lutimonas sp. YSD2104]WKK66866.1 type IX secretion system sortase PorU [Lutimonas sp. YSD2104]
MSFKKYILFCFVALYTLQSVGQNSSSKSFDLIWDDQKTVKLNESKSVVLPLVEGNFFDAKNLPTYTQVFNVQNNTIVHEYQIKNVKFSTLSDRYLGGIVKTDIPSEIKSELSLGKSANMNKVILQLTPLINNNGTIQKITSFTLAYTLKERTTNIVSSENRNSLKSNRSVLSTGNWFKFRIDTTGIFKIDRELLEKIGVSTSGLDPRNIRIYGNGGKMLPQLNSEFRYEDLQENSIFISGEEDGVFDSEDYILFFGQGPHHWELNSDDFLSSEHKYNIYSDFSYYFITTDLGNGKRVQTKNQIEIPAQEQIRAYERYDFYELDEVNLFANGQQWLGEDFSFESSQKFLFDFDDLLPNEELSVRVRGVATSTSNTSMDITLNNQDLMSLSYSAIANNSITRATSDDRRATTLVNGDQIEIGITYNNSGNPSSRAYLDFIEVIGKCELVWQGRQFSFRNSEASDPGSIYEYVIRNASGAAQVWDLNDPLHPKKIENQDSGNNFIFKTQGQDSYFLLHGTDDYFIPEAIEDNVVPNQNLHGLRDLDYIVITPDYLKSEAERLTEHHSNVSGFITGVIDLNEIFNEFGSGSPDLTAIRDFIRFLYLNASGNETRIKYVCLFGDASFDFKDRITDNNNIVPAFQSYESFNLATAYVTDDYFGMMDEAEGELRSSDMQDVAMGRLPVSSPKQARELVDKTLSYYAAEALGSWRNKLTFIADDPDNSGEFVLQKALDLITEDIEENKPSFNIKKIYADAHQQVSTAGGERYPTVNEAINNAVETGTLMIDYFGHGGVNGWAEERILEVPQIQSWNNSNTLPLLVTVTCEFARFDNPIRPTAGEYTLWNAGGGASHLISTTREIFISVGEVFNRNLIKNLLGFEGQDYSISEALMYAKHESFTSQRFFVYSFGDPAMKMAQVKPNIEITKMNGTNLSQKRDTLKALSRIQFEGRITDENNQPLNNFNGTLNATIYDKPLNKTTLDNDNLGKKMPFTAVESKIFSGRSSVNNGKFQLDFIVPKDIRIAYGNAKISLYGENNLSDRNGADLSITIGGIDQNAPEDSQGPEIRLFMNDESFVDGGNTSESPVLYAILEDDSGINTSITAVDHDIIAILDDDNNNPYVLNDYYETELDNFKKGKVKFPFRDLEPGLHTIKFKCWDTYNNPSESTLSFIVVNDNDLILSNVLNYPNPFINYTEFWFNHNKPNEPLDVQVQIFTVSGKLIKTLHRSVQSDGLLSRDISWDGLDDFGNKIGKGVYVYKLHVRSQITTAQAEKFEKLVILQ